MKWYLNFANCGFHFFYDCTVSGESEFGFKCVPSNTWTHKRTHTLSLLTVNIVFIYYLIFFQGAKYMKNSSPPLAYSSIIMRCNNDYLEPWILNLGIASQFSVSTAALYSSLTLLGPQWKGHRVRIGFACVSTITPSPTQGSTVLRGNDWK